MDKASTLGGPNSKDVKMLVELFDLTSSPEIGDNWEETARWIKYEEDVEGLDKHWGRPHVAFLSFHSLMQFRQFFGESLVLFDPRAETFSDIISRLAIGMMAECGMDSTTADRVANTLKMQRHRGAFSRRTSKRSVTGQPSFGYKSEAHSSMASIGEAIEPSGTGQANATDSSGDEKADKGARPTRSAVRKITPISTGSISKGTRFADQQSPGQQPPIMEDSIGEGVEADETRRRTLGDIAEVTPTADELARLKERLAHMNVGSVGRRASRPFLRRLSTAMGFDGLGTSKDEDGLKSEITDLIPSLTECTHVYTGVVATMADARIVMIRLSEPKRFDELTTSTLPVRFIFIIVGPSMPDVDYHELGRTAATFMSNTTFGEIAKTAASRQQLITAIDEFLDLSIIVPPGDIDSRQVLTVDDVRRALKQRKRAKTSIVEKEKSEKGADGVVVAAPVVAPPDRKEVKELELEPAVIQRRGRQDHVKDSLRRTGRPFGGVIDDIKYRAPFYFRDYRDALNFQCVTSALFMFCANFASAVAFGEVMGDKTDGYMGVTEILLAHGVCGVIWGMVACQPLCIQAAVGPFLVFEAGLFAFCESQDIDFLSVRVWTGVWTVVFTLMTTLVEGSFVVRYLTRFTEDIFTGLIAFIFIWEAFKFLYSSFMQHPVGGISSYCFESYQNATFSGNITDAGVKMYSKSLSEQLYSNSTVSPLLLEPQNQPNTALMSLLLVLLTFVLTYSLKTLRHSAYFGRTIRKTLSEFGVPISVVIVIALYTLVFDNTYVTHLKAPISFSLTDPSKRGWFVHPLGTRDNPLPMWAIWASIVPALLVTILVFAEVEIIEVLLAKPDRGLQRPHGFHWDLIVCSGLLFGCALFGLPWMCPAAVQSLSHVSSLTVMKRTAPGAAPKIDHVVEQRVTCIVVGALHAAAAFAGVALRIIPVPVLFGLFLYLGVMGLLGLQFVDRLILAFMPQKYFPDAPFCKQVSVWRMHLFTFIQLLCFAVLLAVNLIQLTALAFPFVLILILLLRMFVMPRIFESYELDAIDGRGEGQPKPEVLEEEDEMEEGVDKKVIL